MSFLNAAVLAYPGMLAFGPGKKFTSTETLEYRSSYIGLENIARSSSSEPLTPFLNFPVLLAQINSSEPEEVMWDPHRRDTPMGMIYPDDRRFQVSSDVCIQYHSVIVNLPERYLMSGLHGCSVSCLRLRNGTLHAEADHSEFEGSIRKICHNNTCRSWACW